jgi:hypothetical protein
VVAEDRVDDAKEIRIERRLIENVPADPLTGGNATCPLVVAMGVAEQDLEKWRWPKLPDMDDAEDERQEKDGGRSEPLRALGKHPQL